MPRPDGALQVGFRTALHSQASLRPPPTLLPCGHCRLRGGADPTPRGSGTGERERDTSRCARTGGEAAMVWHLSLGCLDQQSCLSPRPSGPASLQSGSMLPLVSLDLLMGPATVSANHLMRNGA